MNTETKEFYEKVGEKYADFQERSYLEFNSLFDEISWLQFSAYLPKDKNAKILDAGCGGGGWSLKLAKLGYDNLMLVDLSSTCISGDKRIFEKHKLAKFAQFHVGDISNLDFLSDETFEFVFCERDPLEYCYNTQEQAFKELVRVLEPGGIITLSSGTSYIIKQRLLAARSYDSFFKLEETGLYQSEEGMIKPLDRSIIQNLFEKYNIQKLQIAGRLTVSDAVKKSDWNEIYGQPELKQKILKTELQHQKNESLADYSSHIFAAGKKK